MVVGFLHDPTFVEKIDAAVRVTDDEIIVWLYWYTYYRIHFLLDNIMNSRF